MRRPGWWPSGRSATGRCIGRVARGAGTVFIDRSRPTALPGTVAAVAARCAAGAVVAVFPEGTTCCGPDVGRFRPAMFQAAIDAGAPVVPVRLAFTIDGEPTTVGAFLGEETLYASVRRVVAARGLSVTLRTYPMLYPLPYPSPPSHPLPHTLPGAHHWTARRTLARAAGSVLGRDPVRRELAPA